MGYKKKAKFKSTNREKDEAVYDDIREDGREPTSLTASLNQSVQASKATGRIQLWKLSVEK